MKANDQTEWLRVSKAGGSWKPLKPVFKYGDGYIISDLNMPASCIKTKDLSHNLIPDNAANINNGANSWIAPLFVHLLAFLH